MLPFYPLQSATGEVSLSFHRSTSLLRHIYSELVHLFRAAPSPACYWHLRISPGGCNRPTPSCTCYHYPFSCIMTSSNLLPLDSGGAAVSLFFSFYICPCCEFTQMLLSFEVSTIQQVGLRAFSFLLHKKEEVPEIDTLYPWAKNRSPWRIPRA